MRQSLNYGVYAWRLFLTFLLVFLAHRLLTFVPLRGDVSGDWLHTAQALMVGSASDLWVACLIGLLPWPLMWFLRYKPRLQFTLIWLWAILILVGIGLHQAYVEFFHFQILPIHLTYFLDRDFISANSATALNQKGLVTLTFGLVVLILLTATKSFRKWGKARLIGSYAVLFVLALLAHNRNIHYRVQWFIPDNLQTNLIERLYLNYKVAKNPQRLSDPDLAELQKAVAAPTLASDASREARLANVVTKTTAQDADMSAFGLEIRNAWRAAIGANQRPILQVILMESLRPSETGYFAGHDNSGHDDSVSLTPTLDQLAKSGVALTKAYSYGTVTRGAQEAAFCGYLGSQDTSIMRGRSEIQSDCLPDLIQRSSTPGDIFWFHGGEGRFDGQKAFWEKHHISHILTIKDFPANAPRSGWGISDGLFFEEAVKKVADLHRASTKPYLAGMLLSVSNHIPWDLPSDAPESVRDLQVFHPSFRTSAYSDWALGKYIDGLREKNLWDQSLVIVISDHGTTTPPHAKGSVSTTEPELKTHINLIVTGGLIDKALAVTKPEPELSERFTAQSDIAAFLAYILDLPDAQVMGESLFVKKRHLPLVVDLGQSYYLPQERQQISQEELLQKPLAAAGPERLAGLYSRAFFELLNEWSTKNTTKKAGL